MKNTNVKLTVNESNLVNNLRHAFTRRSNVLSELMQNARRAGATEIRFTVSHDSLTIEDNGSGITDFSKLLSVATSDWDMEIMQQENPFGMGFLAALYACQTIAVQSNGTMIEAKTQDILNQEEIKVSNSLVHTGTMVTLMDPDYPEETIFEDITALAKGFPISVFVNDVELERPHAQNNLEGETTENGFIHLRGVHSGNEACGYSQFYLQGLPIHYNGEGSQSGWRNAGLFLSPCGIHISILNSDDLVNVVHLDSTKHMARMPDRDVLINPDKVEADIANDIIDIFRRFLKHEKDILSPDEFVLKHWSFIHSNVATSKFNRNTNGYVERQRINPFDFRCLFNDIDLLPSSIFQTVTEYPYMLKYDEDCGFMEDLGTKLICMADLLSMKYHIFSLEDMASSYDASLATAYMYTWHQDNILVLDPYHNIDTDHWINELIETVEDARKHFSIEIKGYYKSAEYSGRWIFKTDFHFAEKCIITHNLSGKSVTIDREAFVLPYGSVFYPEKEQSSRVVTQLERWVNEHEDWATDDQEEEEQLLYQFVLSERAGSDIPLLRQLLIPAGLGSYTALRGKQYLLDISDAGKVTIHTH